MTGEKRFHVGFTGTHKGMTQEQLQGVNSELGAFAYSCTVAGHAAKEKITGHHGDCVGADCEFDGLLRWHHFGIYIHPPKDPKLRAFCDRNPYPYMEVLDPLPYMQRNRKIVRASFKLLSTPYQNEEPKAQRAGGTWATTRFARRLGIPITIFWPDGRITQENET